MAVNTKVCRMVVVILLAIVILLASFYLLAVLTEEFFVPSIDIIASKLKLSGEAAGATLLAIGSSAPEFFTSMIAILGLAGSENHDIGAGTIVGSAIFNVLVIIGVAAMFKAVKLQWKPVIRDLVFYILTIILLLVAFLDGKIVLYESIGFVGMYVVYVFFVTNWHKWFTYDDVTAADEPNTEVKRNALRIYSHKAISTIVPDVKDNPSRYILTFIFSVLAIAGLSWISVKEVVVIAEFLNVNATFLALTVLAAGTSIPDLISSTVVAKQGRGDMAVSNAIGSNVFDILFGLGLPWLIVTALNGNSVAVSNQNLLASVSLLLATVLAIFFLLVTRNWRIGHRSGLALVALYVAYCVYIAVSVSI